MSDPQNIKLLVAALLAGAIAVLFIFLVRRKQSGGNQGGRTGADSASKDFQRLLQKGAPPPAAARVPGKPLAPSVSRGVLTSAQLLEAVKLLDSRRAGWPEILGTLNPSGNKTIADHLIAIRGPHMFAPGVAMQAIRAGCEDVLRSNPNATCVDALMSTRLSLDKIVRADRH